MYHTPFPHDYHYGSEAGQYTFYRLPKVLFTDKRYKSLSDGAKILYGLMLDRMSLSVKNGWLDDKKRVYVFFTLEDVMENMGCKLDKGVKLLAELDTLKGVGLIERIKQGQGKPTKIYVKKFIGTPEVQTSEKPKSGLPNNPESVKSDPETPEKPKPRPRKNPSQDLGKTECSNTEFSDTEFSDTDPLPIRKPRAREDVTEMMEEVKKNIGYKRLRERYGTGADDVVELITQTLAGRTPVRIGVQNHSPELVRERFMSLTCSHAEKALDTLRANSGRISNPQKYLLTLLFNAPFACMPNSLPSTIPRNAGNMGVRSSGPGEHERRAIAEIRQYLSEMNGKEMEDNGTG